MALLTAPPVSFEMFALALIEHFESFRERPYQDQNEVWTIGFGTTRIKSIKVTQNTPPITLAQGREYLLDDMASAINAVNYLVTKPQAFYQTAALVSFVYNEGVGHFKSSTLLKAINAEVPNADNHFLDWIMIGTIKSGGLLGRRKLEQSVYRGLTSYQSFITQFPVLA